MRKVSFRNMWVSTAVVIPIGVVGLFLLREHPEAKGWLVLGLITAGIALRHYLDRHEFDEPEGDERSDSSQGSSG